MSSLPPTSPSPTDDGDELELADGREVVPDPLREKVREAAFKPLLAIAILQLIGGTLWLLLALLKGEFHAGLVIAWLGWAALYGALALWARRQPLAAAVVGLIVYLGNLALFALLSHSQFEFRPGCLWDVVLNVLIIGGLYKAIEQGIRARQTPRLDEETDTAMGLKAVLKRALAQEKAGDLNEAILQFQRVAQLAGKGPNAELARERIQKIRDKMS